MLKNAFFVISGLVVGVFLIYAIETLGHQVYPHPSEMDPQDMHSIAEYVRSAPVGSLLFVVVAWFFGTFVGSLVTVRLSGLDWTGWTVGFILFAFSLATFFVIPHPVWMWVASVLAYAIGTFLGISTGQKILAQTDKSNR